MTTKNDIITALAEKQNFTHKLASEIVNTVFADIQGSLSRGEKVAITGFGTFNVRDRQERKGHNPQTGEEITIAATTVPVFHAGEKLRRAVK